MLRLQGRPFLSESGFVRIWWGDIDSPENSQHVTDWYTFTHMLHGLIFFYLTYPLLIWVHFTVNYNFVIALVTEVVWEIVENTKCVIGRYRRTEGSTEYGGDSVLNSVFDTIAMSAGFWLAWIIPWYATVGLAVVEEVVLAIVIRDNLVLNMVQIVFRVKCVSDCQERGKRKRVTNGKVGEVKTEEEEEEMNV